MAGIQMMMHRCTGIRVDSHNKSNANAITLEILRRDKQAVSLVLFELPATVTDALILAFADAKTVDHAEPDEPEPTPHLQAWGRSAVSGR